MSGATAEVRVGNCLPLENIPVGTQVHNVELYPGKGGQQLPVGGKSNLSGKGEDERRI